MSPGKAAIHRCVCHHPRRGRLPAPSVFPILSWGTGEAFGLGDHPASL